jgi:hypothetical protein
MSAANRGQTVPPPADRLVADVDASLDGGSSTFLSESGKRTYISTTNPITSVEELE